MHTYKRRRFLYLAALLPFISQTAIADSPPGELRAAALKLPVTSRSIRLQGIRETRVVVTAVAADPRGELLAAAGDDDSIRILKASTLKVQHTLKGHRDLIRTLTFDRDGNHLVSAGNDGQLIIWNREESFQLKQKWDNAPALARVCCSPNGREMAAVGFHNQVYIVGRSIRDRPRLQCECRDLRAVAYRDDMQVLAVAGRSGDLHLFSPDDGELIGEHPLHRGRIHDVAFHADSALVVCVGEDGRLTVFDSDTQELIHRVPVTTSKLFAVTVINSELVAVAGSDNVIRIVSTEYGEVVRTLKGHNGSIATLDSAGGWLFSGSYDATLRRWSVSDISESAQRIAEGDPRIDR
jgi:WD40 repeat protein